MSFTELRGARPSFKIVADTIESENLTITGDWTFSGDVSITGDITANNLVSGTYTPTLAIVANLDATTAFECQYMRVGNVVTVSGQFNADATTTNTDTSMTMTLPVASTFTTGEQLGGVFSAYRPVAHGTVGKVTASGSLAGLQWYPISTINQAYSFTFTYQII